VDGARRILRIGLTGGIGSGKSTVAAAFAGCGVRVVDADRIARALAAPAGAAIPALRAAFGDAAIGADGALDRAWMRQRAFGDAAVRTRLEGVLHPLIRAAMRDEIAQEEANPEAARYIVLDIPLLVEGRRAGRPPVVTIDRVLVVDCPPALQLARVIARSGLPRQQVEAIIAQQASRGERLDAADDILVNADSTGALDARVRRLDAAYRGIP